MSKAPQQQATQAPQATRQYDRAVKLDSSSPIVEKWDDRGGGAAFDQVVEAPSEEIVESEEKTPAETPAAKEKESAKETPAETPAATTEEEEPAAAAKPDPAATKRAQIKEAIAKQKEKLGIESEIDAQRKRAEQAEKELERLKGASFDDVIKFRGWDRQALEDSLLIGGDLTRATAASGTQPGPQTSTAALDPALRKELDELKTWRQEKIAAERKADVEAVIGHTKTLLKDADIPAVKVLGEYGRVMQTAHDAWLASGKSGTVADYLADAAAIVEEELADERPELAALIAKTRAGAAEEETGEEGEEPAPEPAKKPPARVAVGRKVGAKPSMKEKPLPRDRHERDLAIKKIFFGG